MSRDLSLITNIEAIICFRLIIFLSLVNIIYFIYNKDLLKQANHNIKNNQYK